MSSDRQEYVRYQLAAAREDLAHASKSIGDGFVAGAANRLYYACFHAAAALMIHHQLETRKHSGIRAALHRHFVNAGLLSAEAGKTFDAMMDLREDADYGPRRKISESVLRESAQRVESFVVEIEQYFKTREE